MSKTPNQKWKSAIIQHRKKCQKILDLSKSFRYVGVINEYGRTLTGMVRPGVIPLWTSEQVKNEFFIISTLMTLRKNIFSKGRRIRLSSTSTSQGYNFGISKKKHDILYFD